MADNIFNKSSLGEKLAMCCFSMLNLMNDKMIERL